MELPITNNLINAMEIPSIENLYVAAGLSAALWAVAIAAFFIY